MRLFSSAAKVRLRVAMELGDRLSHDAFPDDGFRWAVFGQPRYLDCPSFSSIGKAVARESQTI
jgi:hypothetical protein